MNIPATSAGPRSVGGPWFRRFSAPIVFLVLTLSLAGAYLAFRIPVSVFPTTNFPRVVIGVDNGVMPIDQMQVNITRPIEEAVNGVPGLQQVRSITSRGSAEVGLFFDWNVDMFQTLQRVDSVAARVQAELPPTAKIETHRLTFATFPIIGYSLTSDTVAPSKLWEIATYDIKPRINRLDGVATILVQGGRVPEFQVMPDPARLVAAGVTVPDILEAIRRTNLIDSPGLIESNHQLVLGLISGQVHTPTEIEQIVVKNSPAGDPIRLGDIAAVSPSVAPVYTIVTANGKPAVLLSVQRQPESNMLAVADEVHAEMEGLRAALPKDVRLETFYDQSTIVHDSITSVRDAVLLGLVFSAAVLVLFLRDWGSSFVAGLMIPTTLLITCIVLSITGQSFNLMTLGGLAAAVGLVIDDAIVLLENIVLHRDAGQSRTAAVESALRELTIPLIGSTLTPIVVFLPLISITGVSGAFFRALAITMAVALFCSLLLSLAATPALSFYFVRRGDNRGHNGMVPDSGPSGNAAPSVSEDTRVTGAFEKVITFYTGVMKSILLRPWILAVSAAAIVVLSLICYRALGSDLLPEMDEGGFILDYFTPPGSSLTESDRILQHIDRILHATPEVATTSRRTGLQLGIAAVTEANVGDFTVKLRENRKRGIDEIIEDVRSQIEKTEPVVKVEFVQVLQDMVGDLTSAPEPIVIKLFSQDPQLLAQSAPRVADAIGKVPGVVDVLDGIENTVSGPAVTFRVNPAISARSGFSPEEIATDASAILEGEPAATPVVQNDRAYTIRVRFPAANRETIDRMSQALLIGASGHTATLGSLAALVSEPGETEIRRENSQRLVEVTGRLEGTDLGRGIAGAKKAVATLRLPSTIRVEYGGTYQEQQKSFHDLSLVLAVALVLLFMVLLIEFRTFAAPTAILVSALLSTSGGLVALLVTGTTFNIASFMGIIMVVGIVAKNGILLLDADERFRVSGLSEQDAMIEAGRRRLRPIAMTALATIAGMLPLALGVGSGSQMLQPLAIVVIGGLISSLALSLVFTTTVRYFLGHLPSQ
jgi:multidrug efflux pump subunit AcrB